VPVCACVWHSVCCFLLIVCMFVWMCVSMCVCVCVTPACLYGFTQTLTLQNTNSMSFDSVVGYLQDNKFHNLSSEQVQQLKSFVEEDDTGMCVCVCVCLCVRVCVKYYCVHTRSHVHTHTHALTRTQASPCSPRWSRAWTLIQGSGPSQTSMRKRSTHPPSSSCLER
jgi:hypothetical protein